MKKSPKELLCMSLCLILWFNLFASIQSRFVFAQPIEVFFTDPSNGNIVTPNENGNVLIRAEYTGSECPYYMDFYIDGVREAHIRSYSPCTTSGFFYWNTLEYGDGWHDLYACVTYEGETMIAESETFEVYLDNPERPQIEIIDPLNNGIVKGREDITARVTVDPDWVYDTKVKFFVDGNLIDWVFNPTGQEEYYIFLYTLYNWDSTLVPDGQHTISAKVYDDFSRTEEDSIAVVVQQSPDNPPTVEITYPHNGKTVDGTERVKISASDDVGISKVELKIDNQLVQTFFSEPYEYYWDTTAYSDGEHTIEAIAYDASNQWDYHSVNVRVNNSDLGPTVSITNPQNGDVVAGTIRIDVTASDDVGVRRVEFYIDNNLIDIDESAPYFDWWNTETYPDGPHTIKAVAYDTKNNLNHDEIIVNVQNEISNRPPTACFTYNVDMNIDRTINFDATCSKDSNGDLLSYFWDFGDGETGEGEKTAHRYENFGTYEVTLIVEDGNRGSSITNKIVEVKSIYTQISAKIYPVKSVIQVDEQIQLNVRIDNEGPSVSNLRVLLWILDEDMNSIRKEGFLNPREEIISSMETGRRIIYYWFDHILDMGYYYAYVEIRDSNNSVIAKDKVFLAIDNDGIFKTLDRIRGLSKKIIYDHNGEESIITRMARILAKGRVLYYDVTHKTVMIGSQNILTMFGGPPQKFSQFFKSLASDAVVAGVEAINENTVEAYLKDRLEDELTLKITKCLENVKFIPKQKSHNYVNTADKMTYGEVIRENGFLDSNFDRLAHSIPSNISADEYKQIMKILEFHEKRVDRNSPFNVMDDPQPYSIIGESFLFPTLTTLEKNQDSLEKEIKAELNAISDRSLIMASTGAIIYCGLGGPIGLTAFIVFIFVDTEVRQHQIERIEETIIIQEHTTLAEATYTIVKVTDLCFETYEGIKKVLDGVSLKNVELESINVLNKVKFGKPTEVNVNINNNESKNVNYVLNFFLVHKNSNKEYQFFQREVEILPGDNSFIFSEKMIAPPIFYLYTGGEIDLYNLRVYAYPKEENYNLQINTSNSFKIEYPDIDIEVGWYGDYFWLDFKNNENYEISNIFAEITVFKSYSANVVDTRVVKTYKLDSLEPGQEYENLTTYHLDSIFFDQNCCLCTWEVCGYIYSNGIRIASDSISISPRRECFFKNESSYTAQPSVEGHLKQIFLNKHYYEPTDSVSLSLSINNNGDVELNDENCDILINVRDIDGDLLLENQIDTLWSIEPGKSENIDYEFDLDPRFSGSTYVIEVLLIYGNEALSSKKAPLYMRLEKPLYVHIEANKYGVSYGEQITFRIVFHNMIEEKLLVDNSSLMIILPDGQQSSVGLSFNPSTNEYIGTFTPPEQDGTYIATIEGSKSGYKDISKSIAFAVGAMSKLFVESVVLIAENDVTVNVDLSNENGIPIDENVTFLTVIVRTPLGKEIFLPLNIVSKGSYQGFFVMDNAGIYEISVEAEGDMFEPGSDAMNTRAFIPIESVQEEKVDTTKTMNSLALTRIRDAESLQEEVDKLLEQAKEKGLDTSVCELIIEEALSLLEKAKNLYAGGNYIAANNYALQAIEKFKEAKKCLEELLRK